MITLSVPPKEQALIEQASQHFGMSVEQFALTAVREKAIQVERSEKKVLLTDLLKDLSPAELSEDGLQIQRALRDEWD